MARRVASQYGHPCGSDNLAIYGRQILKWLRIARQTACS